MGYEQMREISIPEAMDYFENDDVVLESIVSWGKYLIFRRYTVQEWVYVVSA